MKNITKQRKRTRDGRWIDDYVVEDKGEVRVPIMLADSQPRKWPGWVSPLTADKLDPSLHQPGFRMADAATRDKVRVARQEMIDRAGSGWMDGKRRREPPDDDENGDDPDVQDARRFASREAWVRQSSPTASSRAHTGLLCAMPR
jgi:hypothetical protein